MSRESRKLIILAGPSGGGKTTFSQRLAKEFPDQLQLSISSTTRSPRPNEKEGREYFFLSTEEFKKEIQAGHFAEWAEVHGKYYGTSKTFIEQTLQKGRSVLLDIDVQGAASLRKSFPHDCLGFFIMPPSVEELRKRLTSRGTESSEALSLRIQNAENEMKRKDEFDFLIINDHLDRAYEEIKSKILAVIA